MAGPSPHAERALVTGAAGFVGARLVRGLVARGAEVHAVIRPSSPASRLAGVEGAVLHPADVTDAAALASAVAASRPTCVFHLAMESGHPNGAAAVDAALRAGVLGTWNLLRALDRWPEARVVHVGSSLEYGPRDRALRESDPLAPSTPRGLAKAASALVACEWARANGRPLALVRPFSVYGPGEAESRFVPRAVRAALLGEELALTGPGLRRDYVFVDDVVDALLLAADAPVAPGECFNVGTGVQWSNEELVEQVEKAAGRRVRVRVGAHPASPSDTPCWLADPARARERLGWTPRHDLARGLAATVAWFRERLDVA
jgi:nucleoside-diphosphate-sugar epimerase